MQYTLEQLAIQDSTRPFMDGIFFERVRVPQCNPIGFGAMEDRNSATAGYQTARDATQLASIARLKLEIQHGFAWKGQRDHVADLLQTTGIQPQR